MRPEERKALEDFVDAVRAHYGVRLHDILVFGSRARGDNRDDSDVDLAIVLNDGDWRPVAELMLMADMSYAALIETGLDIQAIPIARSAWEEPQLQANRYFLESVRKDAQRLAVAA